MPELPEDFPDEVPEDVQAWLGEDFGERWIDAIFHGNPDNEWSLEITYPDGTSAEISFGRFPVGVDPFDGWMGELYDWIDYYIEGDTDVDYE